MGRPLRKDTLEAMDLSVTTKDGAATLIRQVGYNKYIVDEENHTIVRLNTDLVEDYDATLTLYVTKGEDEEAEQTEESVLKITKHLFTTDKGVYAYELTEDGIVFADENVSLIPANDESKEDDKEGGKE